LPFGNYGTVLFVPINGLANGTGYPFISLSVEVQYGMHLGFLLKYKLSVILNRSGEGPKGKAVLKTVLGERSLFVD
jgi:hypothetical protein